MTGIFEYTAKYIRYISCNMKSFNDWWNTVPEDLRSKSHNGDETSKPMLNQVNDVLLNLHLAGMHDIKPSSRNFLFVTIFVKVSIHYQNIFQNASISL